MGEYKEKSNIQKRIKIEILIDHKLLKRELVNWKIHFLKPVRNVLEKDKEVKNIDTE
jgi:hypothetical protein